VRLVLEKEEEIDKMGAHKGKAPPKKQRQHTIAAKK